MAWSNQKALRDIQAVKEQNGEKRERKKGKREN
eukprot:CAMPEP_0184488486 /NCGR_PEP_ID=MMETSP0113_2-20130426/12231_1 /TAXON_ID=91329 /ORGANISM="Norrisiella sphaerica, Strain BC52" /LENGTH=32 /DNA_ID= /DNA_START= /DNA_END= /DNA_ORIENTATION=